MRNALLRDAGTGQEVGGRTKQSSYAHRHALRGERAYELQQSTQLNCRDMTALATDQCLGAAFSRLAGSGSQKGEATDCVPATGTFAHAPELCGGPFVVHTSCSGQGSEPLPATPPSFGCLSGTSTTVDRSFQKFLNRLGNRAV